MLGRDAVSQRERPSYAPRVMRPNTVKRKLRAGEPAIGTFMALGSTLGAEQLAHLGFDWLLIDQEHGAIDAPLTQSLLQAISTTETIPLIRVPSNREEWISRALDAGAYGVIVPMVNSRAEAEKAVGATKYFPLGYRSNGANRSRYVAPDGDYFAHANEEILCFVMIETTQAIENLEEIATTPGVDGFYIGPSDLAITMGLVPKLDHDAPQHVEAVQKVVEMAKKHNLMAGIHTTGPEEVLRRYKQGFNLCPLGSDGGFVNAGARAAVAALRDAPVASSGGSPYA
jgi:4-hydroxy-2-oxoheptanedioate aldolase